MTKREIINDIMEINLSAGAGFLSRFSDDELGDYLRHLQVLEPPRMTYDGDFQGQEAAMQTTLVCSQERELGRWDEYLDRTEVDQNVSNEPDTLPESEQTIDCEAAQSEEETQAWLF